jgi:hypothetical protein
VIIFIGCVCCYICPCRCEDIVEGEPAELLVLCQDERFVNFKVSSLGLV